MRKWWIDIVDIGRVGVVLCCAVLYHFDKLWATRRKGVALDRLLRSIYIVVVEDAEFFTWGVVVYTYICRLNNYSRRE